MKGIRPFCGIAVATLTTAGPVSVNTETVRWFTGLVKPILGVGSGVLTIVMRARETVWLQRRGFVETIDESCGRVSRLERKELVKICM
jgi:hypothetical protein